MSEFVPNQAAKLVSCPDCGAVIDDLDLAVSLDCGNYHECDCGGSDLQPWPLDDGHEYWVSA